MLGRVKENVMQLLTESFGNLSQWMGRFKHEDAILCSFPLSRLIEIRQERDINASETEFDAALATLIMIEYGSQENKVDNVTALHISTLMEKLEPFILAAVQKLVPDIVATISDLQPQDQNDIDTIQNYLKTRNKSVSITNTVVKKLSKFPSFSLLSEKARKLEALEQNLLPVWNWLGSASSLALGTSDTFTFPERILAAIPASTIMKTISELSNGRQVLQAQDAVWKLIMHGAGLQVIFISATKVEFSAPGAPSIFVTEWLASTTDLGRKIQVPLIKRLLQHFITDDSPDIRIVLLPAVNASDFNNRARVSNQREPRFTETYRRQLESARRAVENLRKPTKQQHAWFLYISDPSDSRYIASSTMLSEPFNGLCLGKNINTDHACSLFSEQAVVAGAELSFQSFERSEILHTAQSLSAMKIGSGDEICQDSLQASFDAFGWFSSLHGQNKHIGWLGVNRFSRWSQRQLLCNATPKNFDKIVQMISQDRRSGHADASADCSNTGGTTILRGGSDSTDDDRTAPQAGSANHLHDDFQDDPTYADAEYYQSKRRLSQQEKIVQILQSQAMTRSIQIDLTKEKEGSEVGSRKVAAVMYMLVLPDVGPDGKVSRYPVAMYIAENEKGHFVNCTCKTFSEQARTVRPDYLASMEVWFFQAKHTKQVLFCADAVKAYCQHSSLRDSKVGAFAEQAEFKWTGKQCSVLINEEVKLWRWTSMTVTCGLQVVKHLQHIEVVNVKFTSGPWNRGEHNFFSVLSATDNEDVNSHAFVSRTHRRHRWDNSGESKQQLQLKCCACDSRLVQSSGRSFACVHVQSVSRSIRDGADRDLDRRGGVQSMSKKRKLFRGRYDPSLVIPDCPIALKHTGFVFENGTYTNQPHDMDVVFAGDQLRFGHEFSFDIANEKNMALQRRKIKGQGQNSHYSMRKGIIIKGELPAICPRCRTERGSCAVKTMLITLYMSDLAVVRSSVDYWTCPTADCRQCVHTNGYSDGFWFLSKHIAISNMLIWNFITLQMQGRGRDMASYHSHCQLVLAARMRSTEVKIFSLQQFIQAHLVFISCLKISFNNGCYGCTVDSLAEVPEITKHSQVQALAAMAPEGARDVPTLGVDGLARMFAGTHYSDNQVTLPDDASDPKSSALGRCICCKKKSNFASRQFDRSPIKKDHDSSSQANAAKLRKEFHDLGCIIKNLRKENLLAIPEAGSNPIASALVSIKALICHSQQPQLLQVLGLVSVCAQPNVLIGRFGEKKTQLLLRYTGEFLGQISGSNSVLTLLKPWAIRNCLALCDAIDRAKSDKSAVEEAEGSLATFKSTCQPQLATPGPLAASLTTLLEFVDLRESPNSLQSEANTAIVSALRFVAQRTAEVMDFHKLHHRPLSECSQAEREEVRAKGFEFPVPVRFPGRDTHKEFTDEELGIKAIPAPSPSNPIEDNGAYFFTKHGGCIREPLGFEGEGDSGDCEKPGFKRNGRAGRFVNKLMAVFMYCACHGEYMGYHTTRNEGRKDPWNVIFRRKKTFPHNISYDYVCG